MSDADSYRSNSPTHLSDARLDQRLDDHRNQPTSLPIRSQDADSKGDKVPEIRTPPARQYSTRRRRPSMSEGLDLKDMRTLSVTQGILMNPRKKKSTRSNSNSDNLEADLVAPMIKVKTNDTATAARRTSVDSDADSHASRASQETEEDVCFPMDRDHVRIRGIDFDEIEEFINEEKESERRMREQQQIIAQSITTGSVSSASAARRPSTAALKYTPKNILQRTTSLMGKLSEKDDSGETLQVPKPSDSFATVDLDDKQRPTSDESSNENVKFGATRVNDPTGYGVDLPDRFSFFSTNLVETVHAPDIPSLVGPGQSFRELFNEGQGTWWLDCGCPTDAEMKVLSKAFGLHPLTSEDIRMQETREKVELFKNYYFVSFHTFEPDKESEDYLEPINVYVVVFREGILTFHFSPIHHPANVRRRVRQLKDYVDVSADWICYAIIDDITDGFIPVITGIEYEADAIEDSVFVAREMDFGDMLQRIGESRRKVMTLMRLLSGKADVIRMFAKRCQDEASYFSHQYQSQANLAHATEHDQQSSHHPLGFGDGGTGGISFGRGPGAGSNAPSHASPPPQPSNQYQFHHPVNIAQPRADIALYLGDIQDHVVTMFQNLLAYEKIFSRSHSNYLAQLQVESVNSNNQNTAMLSKVTIIGTTLLPLNVVTGLFGMNVNVPGQQASGLKWFFGIFSVMIFGVIVIFLAASYWVNSILKAQQPTSQSAVRSIKSFSLRRNRQGPAKSMISFPGKYE